MNKRIPWNKGLKGIYSKKTIERIRKSLLRTYKKHPEIQKKHSESKIELYKEHPEIKEKIRKSLLKTYEKNPEIQKNRVKKWKKTIKEHPEIRVKIGESLLETYKKYPKIIWRQVKSRSETLKKHPEIIERERKRHIKTLKEHPEIVENWKNLIVEYWKNPEHRKMQSKKLQKYWRKPEMICFARERRLKQKLPTKDTLIERIMQQELKRRNLKFEAQYPLSGKYLIDIAFPKIKLAVECDGDYYHANPTFYDRRYLDHTQKIIILKDRRKNKHFKKIGWKLLHFWGSEIETNVGKCVDKIGLELRKR